MPKRLLQASISSLEKKYEEGVPTSHNIEVPFVKKNEYQLIDVDQDGFCNFLLENGECKEDLKLPEDEPEMSEKIRADFGAEKDLLVTVISAMGQEKIIGFRESTK